MGRVEEVGVERGWGGREVEEVNTCTDGMCYRKYLYMHYYMIHMPMHNHPWYIVHVAEFKIHVGMIKPFKK